VMANRGRRPRHSTSSDVAERRAGADREWRSRRLTSSDAAQWRVRAVGGRRPCCSVSEPGPHLLREGHG
jgi:hypothetical protein